MISDEPVLKRKDGYRKVPYLDTQEFSDNECSEKVRDKFCGGKTHRDTKGKQLWTKMPFIRRNPTPYASDLKRPFGYFCEEWLKFNRGKIKESTYVKYETIVKKHIIPLFGCYSPAAIDDEAVETFSNELLFDEELAPKTVKDILVVLRSVLNYTAKHSGGELPEVDIRYPKTTKKETRVLTEEEQTRFVRYLLTDMDECRFGILLALLTGMRIGEICALQWQNISLKNNTIRISATMQRLKDVNPDGKTKTKVVIGSPKSDASVRTIPMSDYVAQLCREMKTDDASAFVLTGTADYMEPRALQYRMERYTEACGLEGVHFHTLRHTFTTRCVEAGFEIKSLSEILGHANTTITLDCYMHASLELKRNNMNKLSVAGL